jgi:hypothetical protein
MGTKMGTKYHPSRLVQLPAKGNKWYVHVTRPKELQTSKNLIVRRSTGTTDEKIARKLQYKITQEIYSEFDAALTSAPLSIIDLAKKHWPLPPSAKETHQELIGNMDGGNPLFSYRVWLASGKDNEVANQLFEHLDYDGAKHFRHLITPDHSNPYLARRCCATRA